MSRAPKEDEESGKETHVNQEVLLQRVVDEEEETFLPARISRLQLDVCLFLAVSDSEPSIRTGLPHGFLLALEEGK